MIQLFSIILFLTIAIFPIFSQSADLIVIDLENPQEEIIPMSRFFNNKMEYVPLDMNEIQFTVEENFGLPIDNKRVPKAPLKVSGIQAMGKHPTYYLTSQYIIGIHVFNNAYIFDRKTGQFMDLT